MSELDLLRALLIVSMAVGPLGTHRLLFPAPSRLRAAAHLAALTCAAVGLFTHASLLTAAWLLFCALTFAHYLWSRLPSLRSPHVLATCVPFLFSNIAALWLVGGSNDLGILGYGPHFSYYAALHGNVLGWILVGALAILAEHDVPRRTLYVTAVFACLVSFLLIAFGIDRLRILKPIGVTGLSLVLPLSQLAFLRTTWARDRAAATLAAISLAGLAFTMFLAWRNELALPISTLLPGIRGIVSVHGALNALVVAPTFLLAVTRLTTLDRSQARSPASSA